MWNARQRLNAHMQCARAIAQLGRAAVRRASITYGLKLASLKAHLSGSLQRPQGIEEKKSSSGEVTFWLPY